MRRQGRSVQLSSFFDQAPSRTTLQSCKNCLRLHWLLAPLLIGALAATGWSDPLRPTAGDRQISIAVANKLANGHLLRHPLDREMSERCFKQFFKSLDPQKVYFYQSDIDRFAERRDDLCREISHGDVSFAYEVFGVFLRRIDEHLQTIDGLLAAPLDLTVDEEMVTDRDLMHYPRTPAEAADRWRQQLKFDILRMKVDKEKKDVQDPQEKLRRHYRSSVKKMHQTSGEDLLEIYLNALTTSFDPHTNYMTPETQKNFEIVMGLNLEGIGASLQNDDGYTVVRKIIRGGAAYKDGRLKKNDKVVGVGQEDGAIVSVVDMKISDVVTLIRGKRGSMVRLEVIPADGKGRRVYALTREKVDLKDQAAEGKIFEVGVRSDGRRIAWGSSSSPASTATCRRNAAATATFAASPATSGKSSISLAGRAPMRWCSICGSTAAGRSTRRSVAPACFSTAGRSCRPRTPPDTCRRPTLTKISAPATPGRNPWS